jgi:hypothetical protein
LSSCCEEPGARTYGCEFVSLANASGSSFHQNFALIPISEFDLYDLKRFPA